MAGDLSHQPRGGLEAHEQPGQKRGRGVVCLLVKLEQLDIPLVAVRGHDVEAVDLVVHDALEERRDGRAKVEVVSARFERVHADGAFDVVETAWDRGVQEDHLVVCELGQGSVAEEVSVVLDVLDIERVHHLVFLLGEGPL